MNKLLKRSITGIIYVAVVCFAISAAWYIWYVLILLIGFVLANEFSSLMQKAGFTILKPAASIATLFFLSAVFYVWLFARTDIVFILFVSIPLVYMLVRSLFTDSLRTFINTILVSIYVSFPLAMSGFLLLMISKSSFLSMGTELFHSAYRPALLLSVFVMIWVFDSFAYLSGSVFGKHKIAPRISPKKSWEGLLGGLLFLFPTVFLLHRYVGIMSIPQWIGAVLIVVVAGTLGDLFISQLKRMAGAKDSGTILPGHGGLLDRFDSFLLILPLISLYIILIA
ncbi:MAG TPA: phosphatidate cytidylyltransferase [Bacteroidales bacterium]|nr:phosphatidate cytidylyltransferase [Bacteroidales bacterium]